jgi:hypothetical protein
MAATRILNSAATAQGGCMYRASSPTGRWTWIGIKERDKAIEVGQLQLAGFLIVISAYADQLGYCWPGRERLAKDCRCSVSQVKRYIKQLVDAKLLEVEYRPGMVSRYRLLRLEVEPVYQPDTKITDKPATTGGRSGGEPGGRSAHEPRTISSGTRITLCKKPESLEGSNSKGITTHQRSAGLKKEISLRAIKHDVARHYARLGYAGSDGAAIWKAEAFHQAGLLCQADVELAMETAAESARNKPAYVRTMIDRALRRRGHDPQESWQNVRIMPYCPREAPREQKPSKTIEAMLAMAQQNRVTEGDQWLSDDEV